MNLKGINALSDKAILELIGKFIRENRINQNRTQADLSKESGIDRSTISEVERGYKSNTITLIQILRALDKLSIFEGFRVKKQLSPLQIAKLKLKETERVRKKKDNVSNQESWEAW